MACGGGELEDVDEDEENNEQQIERDEDEQGASGESKKNKLEIDESLFTVEDLGDIQDELENLDIE
jgi:hypothetical protein